MPHLQGDLQVVFDALYELGVIEPVLKKDWQAGLEELSGESSQLRRALGVVNRCGRDRGLLKNELGKLDQACLEILAMEVAREYAGFNQRESLH
uniref:Uncharacterized protein n=1 Tax=uncultured bacterium CSLF43 TaxID=1091575 RepID=G4WW31_9BACT|nr:hypothetical protein [uncultured bacterium CSLF43]